MVLPGRGGQRTGDGGGWRCNRILIKKASDEMEKKRCGRRKKTLMCMIGRKKKGWKPSRGEMGKEGVNGKEGG